MLSVAELIARGTKMKKEYQCDICKKQLAHKSSINRHKANIHGINVVWHKCVHEHCGKEFKQYADLEHHMLYTHNKQNISVFWHCDQEHCDKKFPKKGSLKSHKAHVHGIDVVWHKCDYCGHQFKNIGTLKRHQAFKHNIGVVWHQCSVCSHKYKGKWDLKKHEKTHKAKY